MSNQVDHEMKKFVEYIKNININLYILMLFPYLAILTALNQSNLLKSWKFSDIFFPAIGFGYILFAWIIMAVKREIPLGFMTIKGLLALIICIIMIMIFVISVIWLIF